MLEGKLAAEFNAFNFFLPAHDSLSIEFCLLSQALVECLWNV